MAYWLIKSEPSVYSFAQLQADKSTAWEGVRNYQARNNMQAMKKGDRCLFYHSGAGQAIVGIAEVTREFYPDPKDKTGKFGIVDVKAVKALATPVPLKAIKAEAGLKDFALVRHGRLSVTPADARHWAKIMAMAGEK